MALTEEVEDLSPRAYAIAAISAVGAVVTDLAEFARYADQGHDLTVTEVVENAADALQCVLRATGRCDDEAGQLLAAINKYLDGWA